MAFINKYWKLLLLSLIIKIIAFIFFSDILFHNGTMMKHYVMASIFTDNNYFGFDDEFFKKAVHYNSLSMKNNQFYILEREIKTKRIINPNPEITDTPGYTLLLGSLWKLSGMKSFIYIQLLQCFIDLLASIAIFSISIYLFKKEKIAYFSMLFYSLFLPFAILSILPNRDYYSAWGIIFSLYFFLKYCNKNNITYLIYSGLSISMFSWFRPSILFIPVIYIFYFFVNNKKPFYKNVLFSFLIFQPIIFLFIIPFSYQYYNKYETFNFTSGFSGNNLWEGMGEYPNKYNLVCNDSIALERAYQLGYPKDAPFGTPNFSNILRNEAVTIIKHDPLFYINTVIKRYIRYLFAKPILGITEKTGIYYKNFNGGLLDFLKEYPLVFFENVLKNIIAYSIPIFSIFSLFFFKNYRKEILFLISIWQFKILFHVTTHLEDRYVLEAYFPLIIILGLYGNLLYEKYIEYKNDCYSNETTFKNK